MHAHLPSLLSSLRQLVSELLAALDLLESNLTATPQLPGIHGGGGFRPFAGPLPPPRAPDAEDSADPSRKGGFGYDDLLRDPERLVQFIVGPWDGFEDGDSVRIMLGDRIYGRTPASAADKFNTVDVYVPARDLSFLLDGIHDFHAQVVNQLGVAVDSAVQPIRVKLALPGGAPPVDSPPWRNKALSLAVVTPAIIEPDTGEATVTLAPYLNMHAGDRVTLRWALVDNTLTHEVQVGEEGRPITFTVPRAMIDRGGFGEDVWVDYDVRDLVYNWSLYSLLQQVAVESPDALAAPWVSPTVDEDGDDEEDGRIIDVELLDKGDLLVEVFGVKKDDVVIVHFVGATGDGKPSSHDTAPQTAGSRPLLYFDLPHALFPGIIDGNCAVWYTVTRAGKELTSARRRLSVIGRRDTLEAPRIVEAIGDLVDPAGGAVTIQVDAQPLIVAGTRVVVELYGRTAGNVPIGHTDVRDIGNSTPFPLYFSVPGEKIAALAGSTFTIRYTVETFDAALGVYVRRVGKPFALTPSPSATYRVSGASRTLPKPVVPLADGEQLDPDKVNDLVGLEVDVSYPGMVANDKVTLTFIGTRYATPWSDTLTVRAGDTKVRFLVPKRDYVTGNDGADVTLEYSVLLASNGATARSETLLLHVGKGLGELPKPVVPQESAGHLLPGSILDGVTIQVPVSVELKPTDQVYAYFATWRSAPKAGVIPVSFQVPADVLGPFMGTDVDIWYVVEREGVPYTSGKLSLHMMPFGNEDKLLPTPAITQASGNVLDLATFNGNATATCIPWPFIAQGQRVWLRVHGTKDNGSADTILVYDGDAVTADMVTKGLSKAVNRARLEALRDNSTITVELKVAFNPADDEAKAITFPKRVYTIRTVEALAIKVMPSTVQVGTSFSASASGGRPPYTFSASPTSVATIGASGSNGHAVSVGTCVITVTDNIQTRASNSLVVEGLAIPPAPTLPDFGSNSVDIASAAISTHAGLRIQVPAYPGIAVNQSIELRCEFNTGTAWTTSWVVNGTGVPPVKVLPKGTLFERYDAGARTAQIFYRVTQSGGGNPVQSNAKSINLTESLGNYPTTDNFEDMGELEKFTYRDRPAMTISANDTWIAHNPGGSTGSPWCTGRRLLYQGNLNQTIRFTFKRRCWKVVFGYMCHGSGSLNQPATIVAYDASDSVIYSQTVSTGGQFPHYAIWVTVDAQSRGRRISYITVTSKGQSGYISPAMDNFTITY